MKNLAYCVSTMTLFVFLSRKVDVAVADQGIACRPQSHCLTVQQSGKPDPNGNFVAQCTGQYPDYVDEIPEGYTGQRFVLSQTWPAQLPTLPSPWTKINPKDPTEARSYVLALRDNVYSALLPVKWDASKANPPWFHVPWMNVGNHPREFVSGMTDERQVTGPELGLKPGVTIQNYAVGFYNSRGGYAIGQFWNNGTPDTSKAQMPDGTVIAKVLATTASKDDFAQDDILNEAPTIDANVKLRGASKKSVKILRVLQIDLAVRDSTIGTSGWVFATLAYDKSSTEKDPWMRMEPVGLMWGNDHSLTPTLYAAGTRPTESTIFATAPAYARQHLGWLDRLNGPVDNPTSACMSCHGAAQTGANSPMTWSSGPLKGKCTDDQKLNWFRNLKSDEPFGTTNADTCELTPTGNGFDNKPLVALDFSLQQSVGFQNASNPSLVNPCASGPTLIGSPAKNEVRALREEGADNKENLSTKTSKASKPSYAIER